MYDEGIFIAVFLRSGAERSKNATPASHGPPGGRSGEDRWAHTKLMGGWRSMVPIYVTYIRLTPLLLLYIVKHAKWGIVGETGIKHFIIKKAKGELNL